MSSVRHGDDRPEPSASSRRSPEKSTGTNRSDRAHGERSPTWSRLSCWEAGWSISKTSTSANSDMRQARSSRPAPRITSCGDSRERTASSITMVRATITSAVARSISNSARWAQLWGGTPPRTRSTGTRSSSRSNAIAVASWNLPGATSPSAAARPWQTSTAVRLAGRVFTRGTR